MRKQNLTLVLFFFAGLVAFGQQDDDESIDLNNTVLYGDFLEMKSGDEISEFHLTGNVSVISAELELTSDELYIVALKKGEAEATLTEMGKITKLTATGNVKMKVEGRTAEAGHAEFMTEEKTVVLTINPVVTDEGGTVSGERITWSHGDRSAKVEGGEQNRVKVTLGVPVPQTGYDPNAVVPAEGAEEDESSEASSEENDSGANQE